MPRVRRRVGAEPVFVAVQHVRDHAAKHRKPSLEGVEVARVVVGPRGVGQKHAGIERRLNLVLGVVGEVAVGEHVGLEIVLEVRLHLRREVPELLRPHEFVVGDGEERVAALRNHRVRALAHLVARLEAAVAAARQHDARARGVRRARDPECSTRMRSSKKRRQCVHTSEERREERLRGAVPVAVDPARRREALASVGVARRDEALRALGQFGADAADGARVGAPAAAPSAPRSPGGRSGSRRRCPRPADTRRAASACCSLGCTHRGIATESSRRGSKSRPERIRCPRRLTRPPPSGARCRRLRDTDRALGTRLRRSATQRPADELVGAAPPRSRSRGPRSSRGDSRRADPAAPETWPAA